MSNETVHNQAKKPSPAAKVSELSPEVLDKVKHPPKMDDVVREQSPEERRGNQALVPEMLEQPSDEIIG
jgi:hypothetical protein